MKPVLSICIAAYNQCDLVERGICQLLEYPFNDLEIVISDDCSADDLRSLAERYQDVRLKYTRTEKNEGHDLNIIHAIESASGKYVMIMRSRDLVTAEQAVFIISRLKKIDASYCLYSAVDETGSPKVVLSDKRYRRGKEAVNASTKLIVHPSGQIYRRNVINTELIRKHIKESFHHKFGFVAHSLIRMQLAERGDFYTFSYCGWIYADTSKAKDVAQNSSKNGISIYAPYYDYSRYRCELKFVSKYILPKYRWVLYKNIIKSHYRASIVEFAYINRDLAMQRHYNFSEMKYSSKSEWVRFRKLSLIFFRYDKSYYYRMVLYLQYLNLTKLQFQFRSLVLKHFMRYKWFMNIYRVLKKI